MASQSTAEDFVLPPWVGALAGATGAVFANAIFYPLDLIKTKLQVQTKPDLHNRNDAQLTHYASSWDAMQQIIKAEGLSGLYSGIPGCLIGVASTNFAYFYWYTLARQLYISRRNSTSSLLSLSPSSALAAPPVPLTTTAELLLGAIAGALAQVFTIPVAVVTTRQQTEGRTAPGQQSKGLITTAREVVQGEDGWTGLWKGLKASLVLVVNPSITYAAYQRLRVVIFRGKQNLVPLDSFLLGAISKSLATIVTQPLIVAKVGLQSNPPPERKGRRFASFVEVMAHIVDNEGFIRLFKGIGPQIVKGLLVQGFLMMTKERIELLFVLLFKYFRRLGTQRLASLVSLARNAVSPVKLPVILK